VTYTEMNLVGALERLAGEDLTAWTQEQWDQVDQFHAGGPQAVERMLRGLNLEPGMKVLDVGSGLGGPARQVARTSGCTVVGVDITAAYVDAAQALTNLVGLSRQVSFVCSDIASFEPSRFDAGYTMHVQMSVADKGAFFREIRDHLRPRARFATFEVCLGGSSHHALPVPLPWSIDGTDNFLSTPDDLLDTIHSSGFEVVDWVDESAWSRGWFDDARERMAVGGTGASLPALLIDGPNRVLNFALALDEGTVTVHRGSFICA